MVLVNFEDLRLTDPKRWYLIPKKIVLLYEIGISDINWSNFEDLRETITWIVSSRKLFCDQVDIYGRKHLNGSLLMRILGIEVI